MLLLRSSRLLQALGSEGDGVSSAFPKGKQNGVFLLSNMLRVKEFQ
jgi:hypothetical protein